MKTTVIYHSADYDGIFCREIARKFLPPDTEFIGWDFGDEKLFFPAEGTVYVVDLSPDCFHLTTDNLPLTAERQFEGTFNRLIWIDHHKSSIEKWPKHLTGYRIDGVAACRLLWQWFSKTNTLQGEPNFPVKQDYVDRKVAEPIGVTLAGEYDVWSHSQSNEEDIAFQFGLDAHEFIHWDLILTVDDDIYVQCLVDDGKVAMNCYKKRDADIIKSRSFKMTFEDVTFLCLNTARCNSNTFAALDVPQTGHDALMGFYYDGKKWTISMYHAAHRKDLDLSLIAVKYGGGGHRGACGFRADKLPWI